MADDKLGGDRKRYLFGVLNLVHGLVIGAVPVLVPSREPAFNWVIGVAAVSMLLAAPALVFAGKHGRRLAAAACLINWLVGLAAAALIVFSAAYLYGIYGRHGHAVGSISFVVALLVLLVFWLVPAHELHYLRRRSGPPDTADAAAAEGRR
jgi:small-conductance mechanosensitive channel